MSQQQNYDLDLPEDFDSGMKQEFDEGVQLPFEVPVAIWFNGNPVYGTKKFKEQVGDFPVLYGGGWNMYLDSYELARVSYGDYHTFSLFEQVAFKKGEHDAYMAQNLTGALIGYRTRWMWNEEYQKSRSHLQALLFAGIRTEEGIIPYAPVMLTAKGYSSKFILEAINRFRTATFAARAFLGKQHGRSPLSEKGFYMVLGRFGNKRIVEKFKDSEIVPCQIGLPKDVTPEWLVPFHVGREVAENMLDLFDQSKDWLNDKAWKNAYPKPGTPQAANAPAAPPAASEPEEPPLDEINNLPLLDEAFS